MQIDFYFFKNKKSIFTIFIFTDKNALQIDKGSTMGSSGKGNCYDLNANSNALKM